MSGKKRVKAASGDRVRAYYTQAGTSEPTVYAHYLYGSDGNRVKKVVRKSTGNEEVTVYIDGGFEYIYEWDGSSRDEEMNVIHVMDGRSRIARVHVYGSTYGGSTSDPILYNLEDHLGNSSFTLDDSGGEWSQEEYFPFGESSFGGYAKKRYRFCGKERDEESGLYYYGARYYAPWNCRFVSVDPLADKYPFYTPYQYAGNRPVIAIDIDGKEPDPEKTGSSPKPIKMDFTPEKLDPKVVEDNIKFSKVVANHAIVAKFYSQQYQESIASEISKGLFDQPADATNNESKKRAVNLASRGSTSTTGFGLISFLIASGVGEVMAYEPIVPEKGGAVKGYQGFISKERAKMINLQHLTETEMRNSRIIRIEKTTTGVGWGLVVAGLILDGVVLYNAWGGENQTSAAVGLGVDLGIALLTLKDPRLGAVAAALWIGYRGGLELWKEAGEYAQQKEIQKRRDEGELILPPPGRPLRISQGR